MFQHKGRVRVAIDKQCAESGGVDKLFEETLAAGAEDIDLLDPGRTYRFRCVGFHFSDPLTSPPLFFFLVSCTYLSEPSGWSTAYSVRAEFAGEDNGCGHPVWSFTGTVVQ